MAIKSIESKGVRELYESGCTKRIGSRYQRKLLELLDILAAATSVIDLQGVSKFRALQGNRRGVYSMHVNGPKVITFGFENGEASNIDFGNCP